MINVFHFLTCRQFVHYNSYISITCIIILWIIIQIRSGCLLVAAGWIKDPGLRRRSSRWRKSSQGQMSFSQTVPRQWLIFSRLSWNSAPVCELWPLRTQCVMCTTHWSTRGTPTFSTLRNTATVGRASCSWGWTRDRSAWRRPEYNPLFISYSFLY